MKNKVKIAFGIFLLLAIFVGKQRAYAQQDPMYTQYMDNLLVINPGFAGSKDMGYFLLVGRNQWSSFDKAPRTGSFSYNTSLENKNVGLGVSVLSDNIWPLKQTGIYLDYSYFIKVSEKFKLGMGLKGGVSFYRASLVDLETVNPDPTFDKDIYKNFLPNVGVGFFLYSSNTYFGISAPRLVENKITREDVTTNYVGRQKLHLYFVAGHQFNLSRSFQLKPSVMAKWVRNAPISFDVNALVGFKERFWLGAMYRFDASYGFIAQFKPTAKMTIGYSYDIVISPLRTFNNGSHEIMFSYDFDLFQRKKGKSLPPE